MQHHLGAVADDSHFLAAGHFVTLGHLQCSHNACHLGTHILAVHGLIVAALCLLQGDGGLLGLGGGIGGIHRVQHSAFLHNVAFLNGAGEHLACHQRFDIVCISRVQRTGAAEGVGQIPLFRRGLHIAHIHIGVLCPVRTQDEPSAQHGHTRHRHHPLPVFAKKCSHFVFSCGSCLTGSRLLCRSILLLFKDHACCFLLYLSEHLCLMQGAL